MRCPFSLSLSFYSCPLLVSYMYVCIYMYMQVFLLDCLQLTAPSVQQFAPETMCVLFVVKKD